jgi:hypothetical protein
MARHKKSKSSILYKTLQELSDDLKNSHPDVKEYVDTKTPVQLLEEIKNKESTLYSLIPIHFLSSSVQGLQYIKILCIFQPDFEPTPAIPSVPVAPTPGNLDIQPDFLNQVPENISMLLTPNDSNRDIMNLATELFQDVNIQQSLNNETPDINNMMGIFNNISTIVQNKLQSGELDSQRLHNQAMTMCTQLQGMPEINQMLNTGGSNGGGMPDLQSLFSQVASSSGSGGGGMPDLQSLFSQVASSGGGGGGGMPDLQSLFSQVSSGSGGGGGGGGGGNGMPDLQSLISGMSDLQMFKDDTVEKDIEDLD